MKRVQFLLRLCYAIRFTDNSNNLIDVDNKFVNIILNYIYPSVILKPTILGNVLYATEDMPYDDDECFIISSEDNDSFMKETILVLVMILQMIRMKLLSVILIIIVIVMNFVMIYCQFITHY